MVDHHKQLQQHAEMVVARAIKAAPFVGEFLERLNHDIGLIDEQWQNYHGDELMKKRIAKKANVQAKEKFWAAATDQARKELKNEGKT